MVYSDSSLNIHITTTQKNWPKTKNPKIFHVSSRFYLSSFLAVFSAIRVNDEKAFQQNFPNGPIIFLREFLCVDIPPVGEQEGSHADLRTCEELSICLHYYLPAAQFWNRCKSTQHVVHSMQNCQDCALKRGAKRYSDFPSLRDSEIEENSRKFNPDQF